MDTKWKKSKGIDKKSIVVVLAIVMLSIGLAFGRQLLKDRYLMDIDFYRSGYLNIDVMNIIDMAYKNSTENMDDESYKSYKSIRYLVVNKDNSIITNTSEKSVSDFEKKFKNYPYYLVIDDKFDKGYKFKYKGEYEKEVSTDFYEFDKIFKNVKNDYKDAKDTKIYIAVPNIKQVRKYDTESWGYTSYYNVAVKPIITYFSVIGIALVGLVFFLLKYRKLRNVESRTLKTYFNVYSKLFTEIKVFLIIMTPVLADLYFKQGSFISRIDVSICFSIVIFFFLVFILSFIQYFKRYKLSGLLKQCTVAVIIRYMNMDSKKNGIKQIWKVKVYTCIFINIISTIGMIFFIRRLPNSISLFLPVVYIAIVVGTYIYIKSYIDDKFEYIEELIKSTKEIKDGNLNHKIELGEDENLNELSNNINNISLGLEKSIEERLKSERMKTELITNVSHDLKTPLTAMINYISLMKKENVKPEYINDYVQILDKRSQRLKVLIEDLFEAAKLSSGELEFNIQKTDINQLLTQSIVEMDDFIESSHLEFIINSPQNEIYTMIDGARMYRVFENLISNILKYSLENTRVYIDIYEKENKAYISMKNISSHPLNFDAQEITERFTRGDLSRNTEGSGLGLSIAKGFVESQSGTFNIDIIGDLFNVTIIFNTID